MRSRNLFWILLGLLVLAGMWIFWPSGSGPSAQKNKSATQPAAPGFVSTRSAATAPVLFAGAGVAIVGVAVVILSVLHLGNLARVSLAESRARAEAEKRELTVEVLLANGY